MWRLSGFGYQNILITDICNFMNYTASVFCERNSVMWRKVGGSSHHHASPVATSTLVLSGTSRGQSDGPKAWYSAEGSSRLSSQITLVTKVYRLGGKHPIFIVLFLHLVAKMWCSQSALLEVSTRSQLSQWLTGCLCWSYFFILMTRLFPYPIGLT